ncbi:SDR family NAD(P)-dependent oxidoreductase [Nocardia sp. NPDC057663]|uniref:SDR family NAD(P)-dependent oxidoreductase n=1 Tax=Nocardia sp. NPDC057663 TaxID=3346201 RepID=UPI00366E2395
MTTFTNKVAVVTGAGSGIGQALALALAERGAHLAISDIDDAALASTEQSIVALGARVHAQRLDVADRQAFATYAQDIRSHYGVVHQVYNNAGVAVDAGAVVSTDYVQYERAIGVNLWGVIHGTKEFLPHLIASGDGHLVNISSINGIFAQNAASAYCTTKFAVRGFTESVRADMIAEDLPVQVTVVHPGGVATNIANSALANAADFGIVPTQRDRQRVEVYNSKLLRMPPRKAAAIILDGVAANRPRILVGSDARFIDAFARLMPRTAPKFAAWLDKRTFGTSSEASAASVTP